MIILKRSLNLFSRRFLRCVHNETQKLNGLKYNSDQIDKILSVVNTASLSELEVYNITKSRASNIIKYREKYGKYEDITCILHADGILETNLKKLCDKIVGVNRKTTEQKSVITPKISDTLKENLTSVTSLTLSPNYLSWARIDRKTLTVTDWERIKINDDYKIQPPHVIFETILSIMEKIPSADVYVLDKPPTKPKYLTAVQSLLRLTSLHATLVAMLNSEFKTTNEHKVFTFKSNVIADHYKIGVGSERVSCLQLVSEILNSEKDNTSLSLCNRVTVPVNLTESYSLEKAEMRDELGITLLSALAFYELVVFK